MSYDLYLLRVEAGTDPHTALSRRLKQLAGHELNPGPIEAAIEEEKRRLANALIRFDPAMAIAEFDFEGLANVEHIDEPEARRRYRHLELNGDDHTGIQVTLLDDGAEITFPYWHAGEQARSVLEKVWDYIEVLQRWGDLITYDPQLERFLNLDSDFDSVLEYLLAGGNSTYDVLRARQKGSL